MSTTTNTSSAAPTSYADIYAEAKTYNLYLNQSQLSSYGNSSASGVVFLCDSSGCPFTVVNNGYSELWVSVVSNGAYGLLPYAGCNPLHNGTFQYGLQGINEDNVDLRNQSVQYRLALFDNQDAISPIGLSGNFSLRINGWNYTSGLPQAGVTGTTSTGAQHSNLSGGATAGIVIGALCLAAFGIIAFFFVRRRRQRVKPITFPPGVHEKGADNPLSKPELAGIMPTSRGVPYNKPELAALTERVPSLSSSSQSTSANPGHELSGDPSQGTRANLNYEDNAVAPSESEYRQDKQVLESERLIPYYMEVSNPQVEASSSPSQNVRTGAVTAQLTTHEDVNVLKAQEREMSHQMEISDELQRMRAEHAALLDRIRIAEMRERQARGGS